VRNVDSTARQGEQMSFEPIAADLAVRLTRQQAGSAHPHAPVVPPRTDRRRRHRARIRLASFLHRVARALEPADCPAVTPQTAE
jgi:hypothetical protein